MDSNYTQREGYSAGLAEFEPVLSTFTCYRFFIFHFFLIHFCWTPNLVCSQFSCHLIFISTCCDCMWNSRLRVIAELRHGDPLHSANIVSRWTFNLVFLVFVNCCFILNSSDSGDVDKKVNYWYDEEVCSIVTFLNILILEPQLFLREVGCEKKTKSWDLKCMLM